MWFATLDGALGHLLPCSEKTYRRLLMLQNVLVNSLPHFAGLNPKGFRTLKQRRKELLNPVILSTECKMTQHLDFVLYIFLNCIFVAEPWNH